MLLDAKPMKGSRRLPVLDIRENGAAEIDRFRTCWWMLGGFLVGAALLTVGLGPPKFEGGVLRQADRVITPVFRE